MKFITRNRGLGLLFMPLPVCFALTGCTSSPVSQPLSPQATTGSAFATGHYRNLFVEVGHTPQEVTARINSAFQQLFHGDPQTQAVYFPAGTNANGPLAYIHDVANRDVRSEGMSYGMMIAVQLDRKAEFDALWNWSKTYMYHASSNHPAYGYFSWSMKTNGVAIDEMPAPDGEEYYAMALYFAAARWGNGSGIYQLPRRGRPFVDRPASSPSHHRPDSQRRDDRRSDLRTRSQDGSLHAGRSQLESH